MNTKLDRIAEKAKSDRKCRFTSLAHLLTPEFLKETWSEMNHKAASGIDGETTEQFESELETRVIEICDKLKAGRYKAPPVRRVDIPKGDGKMRPLGITTVEDRLLQRAVARILEAIFEQDFLECSYGYRPGRSAHQALKALRSHIITGKVRHVFEADIRGYFTKINHEWLQKMVAQRIADPVILRLIGKWLRAGVMQNGVVVRSDEGTPQGGPASCVLANIYLHYVLDLWFDRKFKPQCRGEAYLTRFADDYVACFQHKADAIRFEEELNRRMEKFKLELAPEKTRLLFFGRFAQDDLAVYNKKPETFEFLGFKHVCGRNQAGKFTLVRIPSQKSCRKFLDRTREWLKKHEHWKVTEHRTQLWSMLRGFYQYFALYHCREKLDWVRHEVQLIWRRCLRQRSQRHRMHWSYLKTCAWFKLPEPVTIHYTV